MSQISVQNLSLGYEESLKNVFENVSFVLDTDWKLGLIGRNGKGKTWTFIYPKSSMLKAKASSLDGYVTINGSGEEVIRRIRKLENDIGTQKNPKYSNR